VDLTALGIISSQETLCSMKLLIIRTLGTFRTLGQNDVGHCFSTLWIGNPN